MNEQYHNLSLRLYEILDWIGASEEMRGKYRKRVIVDEILDTMTGQLFRATPITVYVFGSTCEGTPTEGLHSDMDMLIRHGVPVIERITDAPQSGLALLRVTDETTKPGYYKLQLIRNKLPFCLPNTTTIDSFELDQYGRIFLHHQHQNLVDFKFLEQNGPAVTRTGVYGIRNEDVNANRYIALHFFGFKELSVAIG